MAFEQLDKFTEAIFDEAVRMRAMADDMKYDAMEQRHAMRKYMTLCDVLYKYICTTLSHAKFKGQRYYAHDKLKQLNPSFYMGAFPTKTKK